VFANLKEAQVLAEHYREHYNYNNSGRPHGASGYLTAVEFAVAEKLSRYTELWCVRGAKGVRIRTEALIITGTEKGGQVRIRAS
jgi:hypothetical protein